MKTVYSKIITPMNTKALYNNNRVFELNVQPLENGSTAIQFTERTGAVIWFSSVSESNQVYRVTIEAIGENQNEAE